MILFFLGQNKQAKPNNIVLMDTLIGDKHFFPNKIQENWQKI